METTSCVAFDGSWPEIEALLGGAGAIDALAVETRALIRRRVVRDGSQLFRLALGYAATGRSLRATSAWSGPVLDVALCDVSLLGRLRECGDFLAALVKRLLALSTGEAGAVPLWQGAPIRLVDGSVFAGPGRKGGQHRLHASYDPGRGCFDVLDLTESRHGETLGRAGIEPGAIAVADRNYAKTAALRDLADGGAFFLVRAGIRSMKMTFNKTGQRLTAQDVVDALGQADAVEIGVTLEEARPKKGKPKASPLNTRVIILRASDAAAARERARIQRSRSRHGAVPRNDTLLMAGVVMVVTNLTLAEWPIDRLLALYRLRWQIELAFKTLKSIFAMRRVPAKEPRLARTWILANLAAALLAHLLASAIERAIPPSDNLRPSEPPRPIQDEARHPLPHDHPQRTPR